MIRKNLVVILHEEQMSGADVASISSAIPGGLDAVSTTAFIKEAVADIKSRNADYLKYGEQLKQKLASLKKSVQTTFTITGICDFEIKTTNPNTKELPIYQNMYIINLCDEYKSISCDTELFPDQINKDGLFIAPNSIIGIEYVYVKHSGGEYEIVIREKI